jgi:hypothetical protein
MCANQILNQNKMIRESLPTHTHTHIKEEKCKLDDETTRHVMKMMAKGLVCPQNV